MIRIWFWAPRNYNYIHESEGIMLAATILVCILVLGLPYGFLHRLPSEFRQCATGVEGLRN